MPKFGFNPNEVTLGMIVFPKGEYELEAGEPKTFFSQAKEAGKEDRSGLAINSKIVEGEYKGKNYYQSFDFNQEYGVQNAYAFLVTCMGFEANDAGVQQFREKYGQLDFSVDTDSKTVGSGWDILKGQHVWCELDVKPARDDPSKMQQGFPKFRPMVG